MCVCVCVCVCLWACLSDRSVLDGAICSLRLSRCVACGRCRVHDDEKHSATCMITIHSTGVNYCNRVIHRLMRSMCSMQPCVGPEGNGCCCAAICSQDVSDSAVRWVSCWGASRCQPARSICLQSYMLEHYVDRAHGSEKWGGAFYLHSFYWLAGWYYTGCNKNSDCMEAYAKM